LLEQIFKDWDFSLEENIAPTLFTGLRQNFQSVEVKAPPGENLSFDVWIASFSRNGLK